MTTAVETSLSVLAPIVITDTKLTSSTAPETDYAAWSSATTYAVGDRVIRAHRIYESLKATNLDHDPTLPENQVGSPAWWLDYAPTNQWAMFDGEVSTQTILASPLTVVIKPGFFNSIYLGNIDAEHLVITVKDAPGGNVIYSYDADLESSAPGDYYEYFFDPFEPQTDFLASNIPPYNNMEATITLTSASADVALGIIALGDLRPLGTTQYGAKVKPRTFSSIVTDKFGKTKIIRRLATTDMSAVGILKLVSANTVIATLKSVLDVPCVVIGTDIPEYAGLRVFGLMSSDVEYINYEEVQVSINVQGMI